MNMRQAFTFLAGQLSIGLFILLQLNTYTILLGASSLGMHAYFVDTKIIHIILYNSIHTYIFTSTNNIQIFRVAYLFINYRFSCILSTYETNNILASICIGPNI